MLDDNPSQPEQPAKAVEQRPPRWYEGWFHGVDPGLAVAIKTAITIICVVLFPVVGCTMHSNTFDAERRSAEVEYRKASAEVERQEIAAESQEANAKRDHELELVERINKLVESGHHPIAARCAVMGWNEGDHVCAYATNR